MSQNNMERVKGIEPSRSAWKAEVLPLNYTRIPKYGVPRGIRTPGLLIRSQTLYPAELWAQLTMEATPRFELGIKVLQTSALPLGYVAP